MPAKATTLDDIAEAINTMGTVIAEHVTAEISELRQEMQSEFMDVRQDLYGVKTRLTTVEETTKDIAGETKALRADIKELYQLNRST